MYDNWKLASPPEDPRVPCIRCGDLCHPADALCMRCEQFEESEDWAEDDRQEALFERLGRAS